MRTRRLALFLAALLALSLAGCGRLPFLPKERIDQPLFVFLGEEAFAEGFEANFPVEVAVSYTSVAGEERRVSSDPQVIRDVFNALKEIVVLSEEGPAHTDDYLDYSFSFADGGGLGFSFQSGMLHRMETLYALSGMAELENALPPPWVLP
ncbi:MAG: hypothetical protein LBD02_02600 [Christensenellaceae bacterium]|jgi:hypothetical protein|nr:hypothetical protein [Christensenellaceae bacterium]